MNLQKQKWQKVKLGEICKLEYGKTLKENKRNGGVVPVYGSAGIVGWHNESSTKSATLIVGRKGSIGNVFYSPVPCFPIDTTYFVEQHLTEANLSWLQIVLSHFGLQKLNMATAVPGINRNIAHQIDILLPPLEEQQKISNLFKFIDNSIEQFEKQEKNLLNLKNQLLKELFSDKKQFGNHLKEEDFETVKFEQIAFNISERVEPQATDYTVYVGLEHLDPDNLKIERKGKPEDVIGVKLKIYEGDIIFGKRRAYQRKVAVSDFEGICSAHSMVLRANETAIEKDLLPFFMQSDVFMNRAVQISEGSLSPTIKWKVLANQEFVIPKRAKQNKIAETFIHFDKVIEEIRQQKQTLKNLKFKLLNEILG